MSATKSSGPLRAVRWADADGVALRKPDGTIMTPALEAVDADRYLRLVSSGVRIFDWRTTLSHAGTSVSSTNYSPDGSVVIELPGDGATGANYCTTSLAADLTTAGVSTIGVWVRVPARSSGLKGYLGVPLKLMVAPAAGFGGGNFCTLPFMARADGKWRFYVFGVSRSNASGSWVWGTSGLGTVRVRASVDNGVSASALNGTDPLQVGEKAYIGGVWLNPRTKAAAIIRFDDGMANLNRLQQATLSSDFVGSSGVTVPAGNYTAKQLCDLFGFRGSAFVLTRHVDTSSTFATSGELRALQDAGWDICFQTHYNPRSTDGKGARLMGPAGVGWVALASHGYATNGQITFAAAHTFDGGSSGQSNMVEFTGAPPSPLTTGTQYWARVVSTTIATMHPTEADALANTNAITFASAGSATFAVNHWRATADKAGELEEMTLGKAAMQAFGFRAWQCWAPNQGAWSAPLEEAFSALGFRAMFPTNADTNHGFASGHCTMLPSGVNISGQGYTTIPLYAITQSAYQTDGVGASQAAARSYVSGLCAVGGLGQNYHHNFDASNTLVLCAYLDELKLRQDAGEIDVVTASRMRAIVDALTRA